jgi:NADH:ubiquinone oxidoreductase subunit 2 (subunit N)
LEILLYYNKFFFYNGTFSNIFLNFFFTILIISFFIKIGAAPFHFWSVDIYDGSPLIATIFLIVVSKFSFLSFISHFFVFIFANVDYIWKVITFIVFISSILIGSIGAVFQTKLKRIFIYSSISNLSLIISFIYINTFYSVVFFFLTLLFYSISMFGLFSIFLLFYSNNGFCLRRLNSLVNFFFLNKHASVCFSIIILSLAGMPPFIGFITKFINLLILAEFNSVHFVFLIFILFSTVFTIFYYIRLIKVMFINNFRNFIFVLPLNFYLSFIISLIALFLCISFFYIDFFISFITFFLEDYYIY